MLTLPRRNGRDQTPLEESDTLLTSGLPHLLDERSQPDFRAVFGLLSRRSAGFDSAVARIRLTGLDLRPAELHGVGRIRVLLAEVNGLTLRSEAEAMLVDDEKAANLQNLVTLIESGRIEVRSAPLAGWSPDFTIFHRRGRPWTLLVGLHWFARPFPNRGPALASLHGPGAAGRCSARFAELWKSGHDVGPAILSLLREARKRTMGRSNTPEPVWKRRDNGLLGRPRRAPATEGRSTDTEPP